MARRRRQRRRGIGRRLLSLVLGLVATLVLLELAMGLAYRGFVHLQMRRNLASISDQADTAGRGEIRILCVGESTTAVAGDELGTMLVPRTAYPEQLQAILNSRQAAVRYRVFNNGIMGGTTSSALELLEVTLPTLRPHVIIAMMGIKDTPAEWTPLATGIPRRMQSLHTIKLAAWLSESRQLDANAHPLDIETYEDLPASAQERYERAGNHIQELRILQLPDALDRAKAAVYLLHIGRLERAEALARAVTVDHGVGYSLLAEIVATAGRQDEAFTLLERASLAHPTEGMYRVQLASLLTTHRELDRARAVLDSVYASDAEFAWPEIVRVYADLALAELHLAAGEWDLALEAASRPHPPLHDRYLEVLPSQPLLAASAQGRAYLGLEDWERAEAKLQRALLIDPRRHVNMWLLSEVYRRTGQEDKEEALRWELIERSGRVAEYFELAKLFRLTGHPERVPEVLERAVAATPSLEENYAALYDIAERQGIQLVVMQYPSFDLGTLQRYAPDKGGVVYIDNLHLFDDAPQDYFFEPTYPQSFSHYTQAGARLLAEHVADTVLGLELGPELGLEPSTAP